jgi:hypothetical protein
MFYTKANEAAVAVQTKLMGDAAAPRKEHKPVLSVNAERDEMRKRDAAMAKVAGEKAAERTKKVKDLFLDRGRVAEQLVTNVREQPQRTALTWSKQEDINSNRSARLDSADEYESLFSAQSSNGDKYIMNRV